MAALSNVGIQSSNRISLSSPLNESIGGALPRRCTVSKVGGGATGGSASETRGAVLISIGLVSGVCPIGRAEYDTVCGVHTLVTVLPP